MRSFFQSRWKRLRADPIGQILLGESPGNIFLAIALLIPTFIGAILEGLSYSFLGIALAVLEGSQSLDFHQYPFIKQTSAADYLNLLSPKSSFLFLIGAAVALEGIRTVANYLGGIASTFLSSRIQTDAQKSLFKQILSLSFSEINRYKLGDLLQFGQTTTSLTTAVMDGLNNFAVSLFTVITLLVFLFFLSVPLTLTTIALYLLFCVGQRLIVRKILHYSDQRADDTFALSRQTSQSLQSIRQIYTFHQQGSIYKQIKKNLYDLAYSSRKQGLFQTLLTPLNDFIGLTLIALIIAVGVFLVQDSTTTITPLLIAFGALSYRLISRVQWIFYSIGIISAEMGPILKLRELLKQENSSSTSPEKRFVAAQKSIEMRDVTLHHALLSEPALKEVSFSLPIGSSLALVGPSSSGKTSLLDLLCRLYDPTFGEILIDGVNLQQFQVSDWRRNLAVVSQNPSLFSDTIAKNISFGLFGVTQEQIVEAAKAADADAFIRKLPFQYQTPLGEQGYRLSNGEKQKIALARALLRNAPILLLDDPFQNQDRQFQLQIQQLLQQYKGIKTILLVTQRLPTFIQTDQLLIIENGSIVTMNPLETAALSSMGLLYSQEI